MKRLILLFCLLSNIAFSQAPQWSWAKSFADQGEAEANSIESDSSGFIYIAGSYTNWIGIDNMLLSSAGGSDIFLAKLDANGQVIWAKTAGGSGDDNGISLALDSKGNVYLLSSFNGVCFFDSLNLVSNGETDLSLTKYDNDGALIWAKSWGSIYPEFPKRIKIDSKDQLYITGAFAADGASPPTYGTILFDNHLLTSNGQADVFIAKLDSLGNSIWADNGGGKFSDGGIDLDFDSQGNVYMCGYFTASSNVYFDTVHLLPKIGPFQDMFVVKYDSNGHAVWANGAGGNFPTYGSTVIVDNSDNIYVAGGSFQSTYVTFGSVTLADDNSFVAKYGGTGTLLWAKNIGFHNNDGIGTMTLDSLSNIYIGGSFNGAAVFGSDTISGAGSDDLFISKYDSILNHVWTQHAGGSGIEGCYSMVMHNNVDIIATGFITSTPAFFGSQQLSSAIQRDVFVARLSPAMGVDILPSKMEQVVVYPNPAQDKVTIKVSRGYINAALLDATGRVVLQQIKLKGETTISTSHLANGVYYIQLTGTAAPVTKKVIVQH
jgi:hypothetical protein